MAERKMMNDISTMNVIGTSGTKTEVVVLLGTQWGDEGKGKLVDVLCQNADVVCRCQVCKVSSVGGKVAATCSSRGARYSKFHSRCVLLCIMKKILRCSINRDTGFETVK